MATNYGTLSGLSTGFRTLDGSGFATTRQRFDDALLEAQQQTNSLQHFSRQLGTSADNEDLRRDINNLMHTTIEQLETTKSSLRELMEIVRETRDKSQLQTVKSLTQSVQKTMAKFRDVGDEAQERLQKHIEPPHTTTMESVEAIRLRPLVVEGQQEVFLSGEAMVTREHLEGKMRALEAGFQDLNQKMDGIVVTVTVKPEDTQFALPKRIQCPDWNWETCCCWCIASTIIFNILCIITIILVLTIETAH